MRAYIFDINGGRHDFDIVQGELGALCDNLAVQCDKCTSIIIETVSVAALLVSIEIYAAKLLRRLPDQVDPSVELSQLMMTTT